MSRVEIHAARTAQLLPSGPVAAPLTSDPASDWFAATAHTLAAGFKTFWDANSGLAVFGYPLTEEFFERDAQAAGAERTVQYFERQRFEWRPENAGTPYVVLLARLGAEDAAQRGLLTTMPFQPVAPDAAPAGCQYAATTQHTVCGAFLTYWQAHGLEFGDGGVSVREALALFGYPLSEPFVDPATGLMIQYFERAVFEYHPENTGAPYVVLLRHLGAEVLTARGW
jgi:spore germination protein